MVLLIGGMAVVKWGTDFVWTVETVNPILSRWERISLPDRYCLCRNVNLVHNRKRIQMEELKVRETAVRSYYEADRETAEGH